MAENVGTQETLSQSSRSYVPMGNFRCLAKSFLCSCQVNGQTLMKKVLYVFVLVLLVFPFISFADTTVSIDSTGCATNYAFSVTTGQPCSPVKDCAPGDLFSSMTGKSCSDTSQSLNMQAIHEPTQCVYDISVSPNDLVVSPFFETDGMGKKIYGFPILTAMVTSNCEIQDKNISISYDKDNQPYSRVPLSTILSKFTKINGNIIGTGTHKFMSDGPGLYEVFFTYKNETKSALIRID